MTVGRRQLVGWTFAVVVAGWLVAEASGGTQVGLLYVAPALLLAVPLLMGRYVGEAKLAALSGRRPARRRRPRGCMAAPSTVERAMQRGGRLVACSLAKRRLLSAAAQ